jgi:aminopeptidase-like protein
MQLSDLEDDNYEVLIDSTLEEGSMTYGELFLPGARTEEVLISAHACHPSLANDNLSGITTAAFIAKQLGAKSLEYSYRFLFIPGTIGAITWLSRNEDVVPRIKHGLVITGIGDGGPVTYKKSRRGNADIDRAARLVLQHSGKTSRILDFSPYGYDERQYCSPAFNLPMGRISRTPFGEYPEYHTSADNLDFVKPRHLEESFSMIMKILDVVENNRVYINQNQKCEPQLGKRGLYSRAEERNLALLWILNMSDGCHSLLDIAERSGMDFDTLRQAAMTLLEAGLLIDTSKGHQDTPGQPA